MSEHQLLSESESRQGTASSRQGTAQKDAGAPATKEAPTIINSEVRDVPPNQSPGFPSQPSLSRTQHRHTAASTGHPPTSSSQPATRIDWYRLCEDQQQPSDSQSSISKPEWFGYGGGPRINVEIFEKVLQVSPGFGCAFVGTNCISTVKEIPESFKV